MSNLGVLMLVASFLAGGIVPSSPLKYFHVIHVAKLIKSKRKENILTECNLRYLNTFC